MADSTCFQPILATRMRLVRLDSCGIAVTGATGQLVTKGFVSVQASPQYEAGDEFTAKNGSGDLCLNKKNPDRLKRYDLTITLCEVDPHAIEMLTGARLIVSGTDGIGNAFSEDPNTAALAMELWQDVAVDECEGGAAQYVHHVFPFVENGRLADLTFENGPTSFVVNASTRKNPNYGDGPFALWVPDIGATEHHAFQLTTTAPPSDECGYQALAA